MNFGSKRSVSISLLSLSLCLGMTGCGLIEVKHYDEPSPTASPAAPTASALSSPAPTARSTYASAPNLQPAPEATGTSNPDAAEPKRVLDAFISQVGVDLKVFEASHSEPMSDKDFSDARFKKSFAKSLAYIDPQLSDAISGNLIRSVSKLYQLDRSAKVTAKSPDFVFINKDIAAISMSGLRYEMGGGVIPNHPDRNEATGHITLASVGGAWSISGYYYA